MRSRVRGRLAPSWAGRTRAAPATRRGPVPGARSGAAVTSGHAGPVGPCRTPGAGRPVCGRARGGEQCLCPRTARCLRTASRCPRTARCPRTVRCPRTALRVSACGVAVPAYGAVRGTLAVPRPCALVLLVRARPGSSGPVPPALPVLPDRPVRYTCPAPATPARPRLHLPGPGYTCPAPATPARPRLHLPGPGYTGPATTVTGLASGSPEPSRRGSISGRAAGVPFGPAARAGIVPAQAMTRQSSPFRNR